MTFLNALAWIFGVMSSLLLVLRIVGALAYSEREKLLDAMRGEHYTFPIFVPGTVAIVCWAWVIWGGK